MVGHVFLFNAGIRKLRQLLDGSASSATVRYLTARRTNLGPIRDDVNAAWDLASHDISIMNFLLDAQPAQVSAVGHGYLERGRCRTSRSSRSPIRAACSSTCTSAGSIRSRSARSRRSGRPRWWCGTIWPRMGPIRIFDKGVVRGRRYSDFGDFQLLAREG